MHIEQVEQWFQHRLALTRALQGGCLGIGAPLGWLLILAIDGVSPSDALADQPGLFAYMFFGTCSVFAGFGWTLGRHEEDEREHGLHDGLTGLYNAEYFQAALARAAQRVQRDNAPLALVIFDLDHFKRVNDQFGHPAGDAVLRRVGRAVQRSARGNEVAARIGGEEFALLMQGSDETDACQAAERLRRVIAEAAYCEADGQRHHVTASLGCAARSTWSEGLAQALYEAADKALYAAKRNGRNRVECESQLIAAEQRGDLQPQD